MANLKSQGIIDSDGNHVDIIPPAPTATERGGVTQSEMDAKLTKPSGGQNGSLIAKTANGHEYTSDVTVDQYGGLRAETFYEDGQELSNRYVLAIAIPHMTMTATLEDGTVKTYRLHGQEVS